MYAPLNNHETARRRLWTDTYTQSVGVWTARSVSAPSDGAIADHAADMADYAVKQFDARFPPPPL